MPVRVQNGERPQYLGVSCQGKTSPNKIKWHGRFYSRLWQQRREAERNSTEAKGGEVLKHWVKRCRGIHLEEKCWRMTGGSLVHGCALHIESCLGLQMFFTNKPSVFANCHLLKFSSYPPMALGDRVLDDDTSNGWLPDP